MRAFIGTLIISLIMSCTVLADVKLPDGYVKGLPESLAVMDEDGKAVDSDNGELFISIDNMQPHTLYTKDVTITNVRKDQWYSIYMFIEPNYSIGNVDMLSETICRLYLDDELIYEGTVDGGGKLDMSTEGIDLGGEYMSGQSRQLHAEFVWNWSGKTTYDLEDANAYYGELSFKWVFYAHILYEGGGTVEKQSGGGNTEKSEGGVGTVVVPNEPTEPTDPNNSANHSYTEAEDGSQPTATPDEDSESVKRDEVDEHYSDTDKITKISTVTDRVIDRIIDKTPFIPEDVKTGYHSELVLYTKILIAALLAATVIAVLMVYKAVKLKRVRDRS